MKPAYNIMNLSFLLFFSLLNASLVSAEVKELSIPSIKVEENDIEVPEGKELILTVYEVKKGDTLSAIAQKEYGDPKKWGIIHKYNKYVKNSHWIFPGDKLILPVISDKIVVKDMEPDLINITQGTQTREYGDFVAPEDFEFSATISGFKENKALYFQGDILFIDIGSENGLRPGQKLNVYRRGNYIAHPFTGELLGTIIEKIGEIQVQNDIEPRVATAKILYCSTSLELGDMLLFQN